VKRRTSKLRAVAAALRPVRASHFARGALVLSVLSLAGGAVAQQKAPSADELRSMYCVEVIRAQIGLQRHLISASDAAVSSATTPELRQQWIDTSSELLQGLAKLEVVRYRLQAYMLPRIPALDSSALAAAVRQGDADFQESTAGADPCVECSACETPSWLPP
jgi:hypothetical protein